MKASLFRVSTLCALVLVLCASLARSEPKEKADPVLGRWRWIDKQVVECKADYTFSAIPTGRTGTWKFIPTDTAERKYAFTWDNGVYVDTLTMSRDQTAMKGKNQSGDKITASKVP
jgi:hypothetical protein